MITMKKGFLKLAMLQFISRGEITGYGLIKKVEAMTGVRPSPGAVYPILKSMEREGWVISERRGGKVYYRVTSKGVEKLKEIEGLRDEYMKKLHQTLSMASEVFPCREGERTMTVMGMILPIVNEIRDLVKGGVELGEIQEVLRRCRIELRNISKREDYDEE